MASHAEGSREELKKGKFGRMEGFQQACVRATSVTVSVSDAAAMRCCSCPYFVFAFAFFPTSYLDGSLSLWQWEGGRGWDLGWVGLVSSGRRSQLGGASAWV